MSIRFENTVAPSADQWKAAIMGARNPMNSWEKSDSAECRDFHCGEIKCPFDFNRDGNCYDGIKPDDFIIGPNDLNLLKRLCSPGTDHRKFMRMLPVMVTITAPLYWWKEFDTYKVGTAANSCSTMHKIAAKEFTLEDFSYENLFNEPENGYFGRNAFSSLIDELNKARNLYLSTKDKKYWYQMIQILPSSYNQKRTVMMNYEVLCNIYHSRKDHKLDEWHDFCDWIKTLPYSELITGEKNDSKRED